MGNSGSKLVAAEDSCCCWDPHAVAWHLIENIIMPNFRRPFKRSIRVIQEREKWTACESVETVVQKMPHPSINLMLFFLSSFFFWSNIMYSYNTINNNPPPVIQVRSQQLPVTEIIYVCYWLSRVLGSTEKSRLRRWRWQQKSGASVLKDMFGGGGMIHDEVTSVVLVVARQSRS
jgi:hypothetical protein